MSDTSNVVKFEPAKPKVLEVHGPGETGWLTPSEVAALTPEIVRERVAALKPMIAEHAEEAERLRRPHPAVWEALRATGFFYHFVPKRYGGCEFGPEDFFLTTCVIAEACASTAWATCFTVEHNWIAALFPEKAQEEFFAHRRYMIAPAVSTPPGKAVRVPGGFRLTARWRFGSGVMNSNWCIGMALIEGEMLPVPYWFALRTSDVQVLDTWKVDGLLATGSNDIVVDDVFIPEHMAVNFLELQSGTSPGSKIHDNPIYRLPSLGFLALVTTAPAVGAARGAVNIFRERLKTRKVTGTDTVLCEKVNRQVMLARADVIVRTSEMILQTLARQVHEMAKHGQSDDMEARRAIVTHNVYGAQLAREAVRLIVDNSGSSVHLLSDPLQRILRDVTVVCSHLVQDFENIAEQHGRGLLGLQPTGFYF